VSLGWCRENGLAYQSLANEFSAGEMRKARNKSKLMPGPRDAPQPESFALLSRKAEEHKKGAGEAEEPVLIFFILNHHLNFYRSNSQYYLRIFLCKLAAWCIALDTAVPYVSHNLHFAIRQFGKVVGAVVK
jgi:hypothetical protein